MSSKNDTNTSADDEIQEPSKKRARVDPSAEVIDVDADGDGGTTGNGDAQADAMDVTIQAEGGTTKKARKSGGVQQLSKWAAKMFDPNRAKRGLVEPPEIIPLNDEFLKAFGKRENEYHKTMHKHKSQGGSNGDGDDGNANTVENGGGDRADTELPFVVNEPIQDVAVGANGSDDAENASIVGNENGNPNAESNVLLFSNKIDPTKIKSKTWAKIKLSNLAFRTSSARLRQVCQMYGPVESAEVVMDRDNPNRSSGRAFVMFESILAAQECAKDLDELDGRPLKITIVSTSDGSSKTRGRQSFGGAGGGSLLSESSIHVAKSKSKAKGRPCPLCAGFGHDFGKCDLSRICFNCGTPGHVNRACPHRKGSVPRRVVCSVCLQFGHHRMQCRKRLSPSEVSSLESNAVCMVCYQRGHYMCKEIKSHFGMHGVSCFNCGLVGHTGYECQRINIDQCQRNPKAAVSEVNRATSASFAEQLNWLQEFNDHERQKQQERGRSRQRGSGGGGRHDPRRGKSTSANQRFRGSSNNNRNQRGNSRGPPPPPPPPPPPVQQTSSSHGKKKGKGKMGGKFAKRGYQARR